MKSTSSTAALLSLATALALLHGPAQALSEAEFQEAAQQFSQATQGHTELIEPSAERFTALSRAEPTHPLLRAYAGAATSLRATTTLLPWKKMGYAEDGLAQIDKGLALLGKVHEQQRLRGTPVSLETRFVAASTFLGLPGMFNRGPRGSQLLQEVLNDPLFASSPAGFQAAVRARAAKQAAAEPKATQP